MTPQHIVGIDLGTTHTVVARAPLDGSAPAEIFRVPQLVSPGEIAAEPLLPSFLYAPSATERLDDPWSAPPWVVGRYARRRGQEVPSRSVTSAKSWLCHPRVDRTAPILPYGVASDDSDAPRISPVEASSRILKHVRAAYDGAYPEAPLAEQRVVLTVPASFDQVARELTVRAAADAGLSVRLLEEPQAAFYDYLRARGDDALAALARDEAVLVLVCDVGGGTTDLALVRVTASPSGTELERVAVGRHLLLGGDNMDLALAHHVERRWIAPPERLPAARFAELVLSCRAVKERLLAKAPPASVPIRLLSSGATLVGTTWSTELERDTVERVVLDGFLPFVESERELDAPRAALTGFGLPYERDPAITRHLAAFLKRHAVEHAPRAVLFNGGVFRSEQVRARTLGALERLCARSMEVLEETDPDLAVARGAVAFGLALEGRGIRITGGAARGYYVGLAGAGDRRAVCVIPKGAREGERSVAASHPLALVIGQPARFELFSSDRRVDAPGDVIAVDSTSFDELSPVVATFESTDGTERVHDDAVRVHLEGELSPIGTLELACVETSGKNRRHRLAFDLRTAPTSEAPRSGRETSARRLEAATAAVERVFGKGRPDVLARDVKGLVRELERILGERSTWTLEENRTLYDTLVDDLRARRRSLDHERVFWMLAGFCLRPGYGHPLDDKRIAKIARLFQEGLTFKDEARGWQQFWIAWRRVAGGLGDKTQANIFRTVEPFVCPEELKRKKPKNFRPQALDEMITMTSSLERLESRSRAELGDWLLERTWTSRDPRIWAAMGRIGARAPIYASAHHVVAPNVAERWLDHLLREKWSEVPTAARAALNMARVTGDRARDVNGGLRAAVAKNLEAAGADPEWVRAVQELVPIVERDRVEFFGEGLPSGLRLLENDVGR